MKSKVAWNAWDESAFERASREGKPVLLSISAVWCHWCHVMDRTTYSDEAVAGAIEQRFVPVRVDNDRRPDINARYNQGGWPTTAFLTPDGSLIAGATYLPPEQMHQALEQIADFYTNNREQITQRALQLRETPRAQTEPGAVPEDACETIASAIAAAYDEEFAGFGSGQKFPMLDALEFLLLEHRVTRAQAPYEMLARTMLAMSGGGMYDPVEGGFFRYSTTREWTIPHFEKMAEDHAGHLRILAALVRMTGNTAFRTTLVSTLRYVREVFYDPSLRAFAGSQDADEEYYALALEERRKRAAPYIDRTIYSNWNASLAAACAAAGTALDDEAAVAIGVTVLDALHERMRDSDGLLFHYAEPDGAPHVRGLLTDQSAYLRALLDAHEFTGEPRFFSRALEIAQTIRAVFEAPDGGFYDHASREAELGALSYRDRPLAENASLADSLLRIAALEPSRETAYRDDAQRALQVYAQTYARAGTFAAPYGRALYRWFAQPVSITLVGSTQETAELREAALRTADPLTVLRTIGLADTQALQERGFDGSLHPAAYICRGTVCSAPVTTPAELSFPTVP